MDLGIQLWGTTYEGNLSVHLLHRTLFRVEFWATNKFSFFCSDFITRDRLCGLVIRVLGYRPGGPGSNPGTTKKKKGVGLERGPLSLVSTTEELLD
jgi:hypothetical protein